MCFIRYDIGEEDLKRYFGEGSASGRELEDNDKDILYTKEVQTAGGDPEKVISSDPTKEVFLFERRVSEKGGQEIRIT